MSETAVGVCCAILPGRIELLVGRGAPSVGHLAGLLTISCRSAAEYKWSAGLDWTGVAVGYP